MLLLGFYLGNLLSVCMLDLTIIKVYKNRIERNISICQMKGIKYNFAFWILFVSGAIIPVFNIFQLIAFIFFAAATQKEIALFIIHKELKKRQ